jgi:hypothetical protein
MSRLSASGRRIGVLSAVVEGASTNQQVAAAVGVSTAASAQAMQVLANLELLVRRDDPLRARRPTWAVADPLLRFWISVLRRAWALTRWVLDCERTITKQPAARAGRR